MGKFERLDRNPRAAEASRDFLVACAFEPKLDCFLDHRLSVLPCFSLAHDIEFRTGRDEPTVFPGSNDRSQRWQVHALIIRTSLPLRQSKFACGHAAELRAKRG